MVGGGGGKACGVQQDKVGKGESCTTGGLCCGAMVLQAEVVRGLGEVREVLTERSVDVTFS